MDGIVSTPDPNVLDAGLYQALLEYGPLTELLATALSVFRDEAPPAASLPAVVFNRQDPGAPLWSLTGRWGSECVYQVKGITEGHSAVLAGSIDAAIDAAIGDVDFAISSGSVLYCRRVGNVDYPEQAPGGQRFNHRGGLYRVWTT